MSVTLMCRLPCVHATCRKLRNSDAYGWPFRSRHCVSSIFLQQQPIFRSLSAHRIIKISESFFGGPSRHGDAQHKSKIWWWPFPLMALRCATGGEKLQSAAFLSIYTHSPNARSLNTDCLICLPVYHRDFPLNLDFKMFFSCSCMG